MSSRQPRRRLTSDILTLTDHIFQGPDNRSSNSLFFLKRLQISYAQNYPYMCPCGVERLCLNGASACPASWRSFECVRTSAQFCSRNACAESEHVGLAPTRLKVAISISVSVHVCVLRRISDWVGLATKFCVRGARGSRQRSW